ncbi:phytoene/squalene synthase family protein [Mucilaginibacter psychrotolerans]|uniref:Phytoene/squalene synthase family protein n=1 Tax=Mucilaginibacter psychrotolerans TaxID=1524096 RepID=A0A4Y8SQ66_9SPHI|nr:phytoene/squalene synthase family protein [Mucilaginibacter psychrotolerans]TFF40697.1 phytoene/squalene synthase family protein [Mucilaginibacter psychrotolerans]
MNLFDETCFECSKLITEKYSTSFSLGIKAFEKHLRYPVYAIYGFVRYADEIVDTFYEHDQRQLIADFRTETFKAINAGISTNPVLQSFQQVVNQYGIERELIDAFLTSMIMDLDKTAYDEGGYKVYIYGSAEVVGLMCLRVFCASDGGLYNQLITKARSLGSAFQKINFLRDIKADYEDRGRTYFPGVDFGNFTAQDKTNIEADIKKDFDEALLGIKLLPKSARLGVYVAYVYYLQLFKKIRSTPAGIIMQKRVRISNARKLSLFLKARLHQKMNVI